MIKYTKVNQIEVQDWNNLVVSTYGRPYDLQQQNGGMERQIINISIPSEGEDDEMNDSIPEDVNGCKMGVKFQIWLNRDPKQPFANQKYEWELNIFWERNFYPDLQTVAKDLYEKGLIEAGDYQINIDW